MPENGVKTQLKRKRADPGMIMEKDPLRLNARLRNRTIERDERKRKAGF